MANDNLNIQLQEINKLPKTEDETGLFIVASQEISTNPKAVTYPLKNKADVSYVEKLEKKVKKIEDATINSKGYYSTEAKLIAAYPSPNVGYTAWVGVPYPGVVYKCETKGIWTATTEIPDVEEVDLNEYAKNGGSDKTIQDLDDEKANTGGSEKNIQQIDDLKADKEDTDGNSIVYADIKVTQDGSYFISDNNDNAIIYISSIGEITIPLAAINGLVEFIEQYSSKIEQLLEGDNGDFIIYDEKGNEIIHIYPDGRIEMPQVTSSLDGLISIEDEKGNTILSITDNGNINIVLDAISGLKEFIKRVGNETDNERFVRNIFTPIVDFNSSNFRIPFCVIAKNGTLIAGSEVRYVGDDTSLIDLGIKKSYDNGNTWGKGEILFRNNGIVANSRKTCPSIAVDEITGRIYAFTGVIDSNDSWEWVTHPDGWWKQYSDTVYKYSDDNGETWSEEISIKNTQPDLFPAECVVMIPGTSNGITMSDGTIVIPMQVKHTGFYTGTEIDDNRRFNIQSCFFYLTPNNKKTLTWQRSSLVPTYTSECMLVEYERNKLMINCRGYVPKARRVFVTDDLGAIWQEHESDKTLIEPAIHGGCQASFIKIPIGENEFRREYGAFLNPNDPDVRQNMTIKITKNYIDWIELENIFPSKCDGYSSQFYRNGIYAVLLEKSGSIDMYIINELITKIPKRIWE